MVQKDKSEQRQLIEGILKNDPNTIKSIYHEHFESIKNMVNNFNYMNLQPEDVFQEGLTRALINIRNGRFKGDSSFATYLFAICRNLCLKEYNKQIKTTSLNIAVAEIEDDHFEALQRMLKLREKLNKKCKNIIDLRFGIGEEKDENKNVIRFEEIATKLNISADNARQRFRRCFSKLKELVLNDSVFNQLID